MTGTRAAPDKHLFCRVAVIVTGVMTRARISSAGRRAAERRPRAVQPGKPPEFTDLLDLTPRLPATDVFSAGMASSGCEYPAFRSPRALHLAGDGSEVTGGALHRAITVFRRSSQRAPAIFFGFPAFFPRRRPQSDEVVASGLVAWPHRRTTGRAGRFIPLHRLA